jgi:Flp pilus assembly pilin Flp
MVEYALAVGMLAVAAIATMPVLTTVVCNIFILMNGVVHNNMP